MLTTDDDALAEKVRFLRDHAMSPVKRYWHTEIGYNYRITNLQAAVGVAQMERIEEFIARKRWIAQTYNDGLRGVRGITLPPEASWAKSVYWMYSVLFTDDFPISRDEVGVRLKQQNIDSRRFFYPIHVMPPYQADLDLPNSVYLGQHGINLPSAATLTEEDIIRGVAAISALSQG